ncbi:hypothetical protein [Tropicimonas sp. S265A]|uniref:hypothetical protein n=1 Tax=Tropicimonas sp. S265A TaxID=3415134 RepID=UPI003C7A13C8
MQISPASSFLRVDHLKTLPREVTEGFIVNYTNTIADPRIDAHFFDHLDAQRGFLGCAFHYIVKTNGTVELGRDPLTVSTRSKNHFVRATQIMIGVVGGLDHETGKASKTITKEQEAAVENLMRLFTDALGVPLAVSSYVSLSADELEQNHLDHLAAEEEEMLLEDAMNELERNKP